MDGDAGRAGGSWRAPGGVRSVLGRYPAIALPWLRARRGGGFLAPIRDETEVVIEGFPRSGNTFAVAAFHLAQLPTDVKIAHHAHVPAQLVRAVRLGLPAVLLVREPEECVLSLVVRDPSLGVGGVLRGWVRFHAPLVDVRDRLVVATFAEATTDVGGIVGRVNERFGTSFRAFDPTPENLEQVRVDRAGRPEHVRHRGGRGAGRRPAGRGPRGAEGRTPVRLRPARARPATAARPGPVCPAHRPSHKMRLILNMPGTRTRRCGRGAGTTRRPRGPARRRPVAARGPRPRFARPREGRP